eukprot:181139-Amphidinium_carterae.1
MVSKSAAAVVVTAISLVLHGCGASNSDRSGITKCSSYVRSQTQMECGAGVDLCGVLTLEMGTDTKTYRHDEPSVHGLWPQTKGYGDSKCLPPVSKDSPAKVVPCYAEGSTKAALSFMDHEWQHHGICAGAKDADDYFNQICSLSAAPLKRMQGARAVGLDLVDTADALQRAGFCVWSLGSHKQIELSACADAAGEWKLADHTAFSKVCGSGGSHPSDPSEA